MPGSFTLRPVDLRRLSAGEWVAGGSGLLLLVSLFLPWYAVGGADLTGWQSFTVVDVILALAAALALFGAVATAARGTAALSVAAVALSILPSAVAVLIVLWRLADPAPAGDASREIGVWLGLAGVLGIALGAWFGMRDEGPARRSPEAAERAAEAARRDTEVLSPS